MSMASHSNATSAQSGFQRKPVVPPSVREIGRAYVGSGIAADHNPMHGHALSVIKRLQICLDEETAVLIQSRAADLESFNHRKGQGLMELNRVLAAVGSFHVNSDVAIELAQLKTKIDQNMRVLRLHISAVNEITELLTDAIQREDSDGTYSPGIRSKWRAA